MCQCCLRGFVAPVLCDSSGIPKETVVQERDNSICLPFVFYLLYKIPFFFFFFFMTISSKAIYRLQFKREILK